MKQGQVLVHGPSKDVLTSQNLECLFQVDAPIVDVNGHNMVMHYL